MKYIIIILFATIINCGSNKLFCQQHVPTDTLTWLKTNIEQQSSFFIGKPFNVLLDTLYEHSLGNAIVDYDRRHISDDAPAHTYPTDTVWSNEIVIYFGAIYNGGIKFQMHFANWNVNTHIPYLTLTFTQKIPFVTALANDIQIGTLFKPVQGLCAPYIVESVVANEW